MVEAEVSCFAGAGELQQNATATMTKNHGQVLAFRVNCSCCDSLEVVRQIFCEKGN